MYSHPVTKTLRRKFLSMAMAVLWIYAIAVPAMSAPQGGSVITGAAGITQSGNVTTINQTTQSAVINWLGFSVKPKETVNFLNPNFHAASITLNRVTGNEQSIIQGTINAEGRVFLINSNGILFSKDSSVNAAGFLASTLNITNDNFNAGNYVFTADGSRGSVVNKGTITAKDYVALLGSKVSNQGTITATKGTVALASGEKVTLNFNGDSLLSVSLDDWALKALVENKGAIYADGGHVIMTAKAADDLLTAQVNNTGLIQARSIDDLKGSIELTTQGGTTKVSGTLDASGGSVSTSGTKVIIGDAVVTTRSDSSVGTWNINSDQFTLAGKGFSNSLDNTNITVNASDIKMNHEASWSNNTTLTLNAVKDIYINRSLVATGAYANLALNYGGDYHILTPASYSGAVLNARGMPVAKRDTSGGNYGSITLSGSDASLKINGTAYTLIHNINDLATAGTLSGYYALAENLDARAWSAANTGIASVINTFSGTLAGLGHTVSNLTLKAPDSIYVGFIGQTASGGTSVIRDIGVVGANIAGGNVVGALLGWSSGATVSNAYVTATKGNVSVISGSGGVGGLVGGAWGGATTITDSYSDANVTGGGNTGGLIGQASHATITNCHATGNVTGLSSGADTGGLAGSGVNSTISNCYATGNVIGSSDQVGGLIGYVTASTVGTYVSPSVTNSFARGNVTGRAEVGGLVGESEGTAASPVTVDKCYSTGNVKATGGGDLHGDDVGGLIGQADYTNVSNSHATGNVVIITTDHYKHMGGLVGYLLNGSVTNSYATGNVTGNGRSEDMGGLVGYLGSKASVSASHATGDVTKGYDWIGGLVGSGGGNISDSWASGDVSGRYSVGGLAGATSGDIVNSYAMGNVNGVRQVGGLVGYAGNGTRISDSHATGNVTGVDQVGGLVASLGAGSSISDSYARGRVTGDTNVGGLVGIAAWYDYAGPTTITNCYWNTSSQRSAVGTSTYNGGKAVEGSGVIIMSGNMGLTGQQFVDLQYYMNGTIDQVLADRAATAAVKAAQVATEVSAANAEAGGTMGRSVQAETNPSKEGSVSGNGAGTSVGRSSASLDSHIVFADSDSYSAYIKAISADGVDFELEDDSGGKKK